MRYQVNISAQTVNYIFQPATEMLPEIYNHQQCIIITDNHIATLYKDLLKEYRTIVIPAGEEHKNWETIALITEQLLKFEAHRKTMLIGIGGGVVTDITGFTASVYMRGIPFGFVPTTLLGMADAAIGGKNGMNYGLQKNLIGTISQPEFILYDTTFLATLPDTEWSNGFAEIIKCGCLFDEALFERLLQHNLDFYKHDAAALNDVIQTCVAWKNKIVAADEKENATRKLLNFGHTAGHALETTYNLPHGYAVGLGMIVACMLSEKITGLDETVSNQLHQVLQQYALPTHYFFNVEKVMEVLSMDKKRNEHSIDYILLNNIGNAVIKPLSFKEIENTLTTFSHASHY